LVEGGDAGDAEDYRDVHCYEPAIGTVSDGGCRVCASCAAEFIQEGFIVNFDESEP